MATRGASAQLTILRRDEALTPFPSKLRSKSQQDACFMGLFIISGGRFRPSETLRPQRDQTLAVLIEVNQRKGRQQPLMVLLQSAIAHLGVSEDALQDAEGPLHL